MNGSQKAQQIKGASSIDPFHLLDVVPISKPYGINRFVHGISRHLNVSATLLWRYNTQRILNPRFKLFTTLS